MPNIPTWASVTYRPNTPVTTPTDTIKFFDENGIFHSIPATEADTYPALKYELDHPSGLSLAHVPNHRTLSAALIHLKAGANFHDFIALCESYDAQNISHKYRPDDFIAKIKAPSFERAPGNTNPATFDYIHLEVYLLGTCKRDYEKIVAEHLPEIHEMVVNKIDSNTKFKKFGVPISFLKASTIRLTNDGILDYTLEIKPISASADTTDPTSK